MAETEKQALPAGEETDRRILDLVADTGEMMLANGAEINRVQQTMEIMAASLGGEGFRVYVLTNGLFATLDGPHRCISTVRHVSVASAAVHLSRVAQINALSRKLQSGQITLPQAEAQLREIREMKNVAPWVQIAASAVGTCTFCYLFGGSVWDSFAALLAGAVLGAFMLVFRMVRCNKLITNILSAAVAALSCVALVSLGVGSSLNHVVIGSIFPLVPGIVLTTGIRDFANSDYLSGTIRLVDALLVAAAIALGVGVVLKLAGVLGVAV